jgi:hypothetical protein
MGQIAIFLFKPAAIVMLLLGMSFLVVTIMRGRKLPQCFSCGAMKVRPSRPTGLLDFLRGLLLIRPQRCSGCRERFYAFRLSGVGRRGPSQPVHRQRALKVVFQFRDGIPNGVAIRVVHLNPADLRVQPANRKPGSISGSPAVFET